MRKKGFTLIELLVVVAVLGILAAVVLVAINPTQRMKEARDAGRQSDIGQMGTAAEAYYTRNQGTYPSAPSHFTLQQDLKVIPRDPLNTGSYTYTVVGGGTSDVVIYADLEADGYWAYKSVCGRATKFAALAQATDGSTCP